MRPAVSSRSLLGLALWGFCVGSAFAEEAPAEEAAPAADEAPAAEENATSTGASEGEAPADAEEAPAASEDTERVPGEDITLRSKWPSDSPSPDADSTGSPVGVHGVIGGVIGGVVDPAEEAPSDEAETSESEDEDWGDDDEGWGDDDGGFDDMEGATSSPEALKAPSAFTFGGTLQTDEAIWVERLDTDPLAKARQTTDLFLQYRKGAVRAKASAHFEVDAVYLLDEDLYDVASRDLYAWQALPRELWVSTSAGGLEITAGRQTVAWGEGNLVSTLDVVNPKDMREPGMVDLEDLRLPVTMLQLGYFAGAHRFDVMVVPEADWGFRSPPNGPFGSFPELMKNVSLPDFMAEQYDLDELITDADVRWVHLNERWATDQVQFFGRWSMRGEGLDLALYAASALDQQGTMQSLDFDALFEGTTVELPLEHGRFTLVGHSGNKVLGPVLLRWELAGRYGMGFNAGQVIDVSGMAPTVDLRTTEETLYSGMLGFSYSGISATTIDLEVGKAFMPDKPYDLTFPVDTMTMGLRASRTAMKERLTLNVSGLGWGETLQYGWLARVDGNYELADGVKASLGYITYHPSETDRSAIMGLLTHDRVFGGLRWDF